MTVEERLLAHRSIEDRGYITPCWIWTGGKFSDGYGRIWYEGRDRHVHTVAAILWLPNYTAILLVCHKCDVRLCFNPEHLFMGTDKDNVRDMISKGRGANQKKTHCKRGHEYTPENTRIYGGRRHCNKCIKINHDMRAVWTN